MRVLISGNATVDNSTCTSLRFSRGRVHSTADGVRNHSRRPGRRAIPHPAAAVDSPETMTCRNAPAGAQAAPSGPRVRGPPPDILGTRRAARVHFESVRSGRITCPDPYQGPRTLPPLTRRSRDDRARDTYIIHVVFLSRVAAISSGDTNPVDLFYVIFNVIYIYMTLTETVEFGSEKSIRPAF